MPKEALLNHVFARRQMSVVIPCIPVSKMGKLELRLIGKLFFLMIFYISLVSELLSSSLPFQSELSGYLKFPIDVGSTRESLATHNSGFDL